LAVLIAAAALILTLFAGWAQHRVFGGRLGV
jgi:hypothetical protein